MLDSLGVVSGLLFKVFGIVEGHVMLARMVACRAYCRRLGANIFVAADEAFPCDWLVAFPYSAVLNLLEETEEAVAVVHLYCGDGAEVFSDFGKAFGVCYFCEAFVHFGAFLEFLAGGYGKVFGGGADNASVNSYGYGYGTAFKKFEVDFGVAEFVGCCLLEYFLDGEIIFFLCLCGIESIACYRSGFGNVRDYEVFLGLRAFDTFFG